MAAIRMSTAGIKMYYAVEAQKGEQPTEGFQQIPEITEIPEMSSAPETLDATPLESEMYRIYVPALIDLGGALSFTANMSQSLLTLWNETIYTAYTTGIAGEKEMWFCVVIPGFEKCMMFTGQPTKIGMPGASVGEVFQVTLPITPTNEPDWYDVPTELKPMGV